MSAIEIVREQLVSAGVAFTAPIAFRRSLVKLAKASKRSQGNPWQSVAKAIAKRFGK